MGRDELSRDTDLGESLLTRTFLHLPGVGPKKERKLWKRGIRAWTDFLEFEGPLLGPSKDPEARGILEQCIAHRDDPAFFSGFLKGGHMWRVFPAFSHSAVYLDIETFPGPGYDEITVIGLYDGAGVQTFVSGENLDRFEVAVAAFDVVVTFNGSLFDLPIIRGHFPHIHLPPIHVDLRWVLRQLGLTGGLKAIEKKLSIARPGPLDGLSGLDAVRLWHQHLHGDPKALETLIAYNSEDIVNLKPLMEYAVEKLSEKLFEDEG